MVDPAQGLAPPVGPVFVPASVRGGARSHGKNPVIAGKQRLDNDPPLACSGSGTLDDTGGTAERPTRNDKHDQQGTAQSVGQGQKSRGFLDGHADNKQRE